MVMRVLDLDMDFFLTAPCPLAEVCKRPDEDCAKAYIEEKGEFLLSIARGFAKFDPEKDMCFNDVFKRADAAMYDNKRKNKEVIV